MQDIHVMLGLLESRFWDSTNILRGLTDATVFKIHIFLLQFFKHICDVRDEKCQETIDETGDEQLAWFQESHRSQIPEEYHRLVVRAKPTDAVKEITRERAQSFLKPEHQQRILTTDRIFADMLGFAKVTTLAEIGTNAHNQPIPPFVKRIAATFATDSNGDAISLRSAWDKWQIGGIAFWQQMNALVGTLDGLVEVSTES